jgi:hypothetical protein
VLNGGCHINREYYPLLVDEKSRSKENQRLGLCKNGPRLAAERLYSLNVTSPLQALGGRNPEVVVGAGNDPLVGFDVLQEDHLTSVRAFDP